MSHCNLTKLKPARVVYECAVTIFATRWSIKTALPQELIYVYLKMTEVKIVSL